MKYEQPDLLEKFIRNERRSKLWTLLGTIAFCTVSFTVVYVAKSVSPAAALAPTSQTADKKETAIVYDTINNDIPVSVNDPGEAQRIRDSFRRVMAAQPKPIDYSGPYKNALADYDRERERAAGLQAQLDDCNKKLNSKPPADDCQKERKRADGLQAQLDDCIKKLNSKPPADDCQKERKRADDLQAQLDDCNKKLGSKPSMDDYKTEKAKAKELQAQLDACNKKLNPKSLEMNPKPPSIKVQ